MSKLNEIISLIREISENVSLLEFSGGGGGEGGTKYYASTGITFSNHSGGGKDISINLSQIDIKDLADSTNLKTAWSGKQAALTAGTNISISESTISAVGYTYNTTKNSFTAGYNTSATGIGSVAIGIQSTAYADGAIALGSNNSARGINSSAFGGNTIASGNNSFSCGRFSTADNNSQFSCGSYGKSHKASNTFSDSGNTMFSLGIGTADNARVNAVEITQNGDYYIKGVGNYDGIHIKGETGAPSGLKTVQEVISDISNVSVETVASSVSSKEIAPNKLYVFESRTGNLTITLGTPTANVVNEYHFIITIGNTAPTLTLPGTLAGVTWYDDLSAVSANKTYEFSILNGVGIYMEI